MQWLAAEIYRLLRRAKIQPGESVGVLATQNMGEPFTQRSLKTTHFSGKFPAQVSGTKRATQLVDANFQNATMTVVLKGTITTELDATIFALGIVSCKMMDITRSYPLVKVGAMGCDITFILDRKKTISRLISLRDVVKRLSKHLGLELCHFQLPFMDSVEDWFFKIHVPSYHALWNAVEKGLSIKAPRMQDVAENIAFNLYRSVVIHGWKEIEEFVVEPAVIHTPHGKCKRFVITTLGSNLARILRMPQVDSRRTYCNDAKEIISVLGLYAGRKALENEITLVMSDMAETRHIKLLARTMCCDTVIKGMKIKQMTEHIPPLQRASFELGPKQIVAYCNKAEQNHSTTIAGAVVTNEPMTVGTGFNVHYKRQPATQPWGARQQAIVQPSKICAYVVSPKADGVRYFLALFHSHKNEKICALIDRGPRMYRLAIPDNIPDELFEGTLVDGDLTALRQGGKEVFLAYDCLMSCGNRCSVLRYDQRLEIAREIVFAMQLTPGRPLYMGAKQGLPIALRPDVSSTCGVSQVWPFDVAVKPVFDVAFLPTLDRKIGPRLPFETDGYVFTRLEDPAYPFRTKMDSLYKWKPRKGDYSENTIDFMVTPAPQNVHMDWPEQTTLKPEQIAPFRHTRHQWALWTLYRKRKRILFSTAYSDLTNLTTPGVYECRWSYTERSWEIVRPREKAANPWDTVERTLENILEDIRLSEIN